MLQLRSISAQIHMLTAALAGATTAKVPTVSNSHVLIPMNTADAGALNEFCYESEVSGGAKATGEAWAIGAKIYWSTANSNFTTTSSGNTLCGYAIDTALAGDTVTPLFAFNAFAT
ncbi:MAG TPA: DUF2190 family protein [Dokdonella sp.]|nr:DUF2190 family protein [Dokdonella sp.]